MIVELSMTSEKVKEIVVSTEIEEVLSFGVVEIMWVESNLSQ